MPASGWRPQLEGLQDRFDLIAFDNRGMGGSELIGPLTVEAMADDAAAILAAEGIARAHIAGHSLGGFVALQLALAAPSRVRSLALLCTFAHGPDEINRLLAEHFTAAEVLADPRPVERNHTAACAVQPPAVDLPSTANTR